MHEVRHGSYVSQLVYYCGRSVDLYNRAIEMAGKANLAEIFYSLRERRLKLLRPIRQEVNIDKIAVLSPFATEDLTALLSEIQSNEEHLIECSSKVLRNNRLKSDKLKEFVKSAVSEIRSSIHWLDVISSYYVKTG